MVPRRVTRRVFIPSNSVIPPARFLKRHLFRVPQHAHSINKANAESQALTKIETSGRRKLRKKFTHFA